MTLNILAMKSKVHRSLLATITVAVVLTGGLFVLLSRSGSSSRSLEDTPISAGSIQLDCPSTTRVAASPDRPIGQVETRSVEEQAVAYAQGVGVADRLHAVTHVVTELAGDQQQVVFHDAQGRAVLAMVFDLGAGGWTWGSAVACGDAR